MPRRRDDARRDESPRTDLPAGRDPYYEGYFGTDEEEGVVREREASGDEEEEPAVRRDRAEDAAGGDREI